MRSVVIHPLWLVLALLAAAGCQSDVSDGGPPGTDVFTGAINVLPDAAASNDATMNDANMGGGQCGAQTCGADQVCVNPCCTGPLVACLPANDGGCDPGSHVGRCNDDAGTQTIGCTNSCVPPQPTCMPLPMTCGGTPSCTCLPNACTMGNCVVDQQHQVQCLCI
jgi:hypothetical protein